MSSQSQKNLIAFLTRELTSKGLTKLILRHAAAGAKGHVVETFEITEAVPYDQIATFAEMMIATAQIDADGIGPTVQRYTITGYRGEDETGRINLRIRGMAEDFDETEAGEEPATARGHLTQLMRHNEATNRVLVQSFQGVLNAMNRRAERDATTIEKLLTDRERTYELLDQARSTQHMRDMERSFMESEERRKDKAFDKAFSLLPVLLSKLTKGAIPAPKTDPMMLMLTELTNGLSMEQLNAIRGALQPEQQIILFQVLQTIQASKEGETKSLPPGNSQAS